jgi:DNA-binding transcriptional LysR family regulator
MLGNESMSRLFYRQFFLEHSADLKPDIEAATTDQMMTLVKSELGLAFVPEPMAQPAAPQHCAADPAGGDSAALSKSGL